MDEKTIKNEIEKSKTKRPKTMTYVAVLVVVVVVIALYMTLSGAVNLGVVTSISSPTQAQSVATDLGTGVSDVSSEIDAISGILGE